jgi:hypothetical protein
MCVSERVLNECRAVGAELSTKPPGVLKLLCPPLVAEFEKLIVLYDSKTVHVDSGRHLTVCTAAFRCVFSRFIERLDMSSMFGRSIILQNLDCVPKLLELPLSYPYPVDTSKILATAIHHVNRLQIFKYIVHCTDEVIFQLRLHCPLLTEVDVSLSVNVTNASAHHLMQFTELKWLNLVGTQIGDTNYGFIIAALPKIANINFRRNENSILKRTGVETLDRITHISGSLHDIDALSQKCPTTTNLTLTLYFGELSRLTAFHSLRVLELSNTNCERYNMNALLKGIGHRLQDLTLCTCSDVNLQDIVILCPSLLNLSLMGCSFLRVNTQFDPQLLHFRTLVNLNVKNSFQNSDDFRYIRYYVNLETIHLKMICIFTVEFIREIIRLGTFKQLEVFHIEEIWAGVLTMEALQLLLQHCPLLKRIEGLGYCRSVNKLLIRKLKRQILKGNFDLVVEY